MGVLVTGAFGSVAVSCGYEITVLDNLNIGMCEHLPTIGVRKRAGTAEHTGIGRLSSVQLVLLSSTAVVYGDVQKSGRSIRKEEALQPMPFYGLTKVFCER